MEGEDRSREEWNKLQGDKDELYRTLQTHHKNEEWPAVVHTASKNIDMETLTLWP